MYSKHFSSSICVALAAIAAPGPVSAQSSVSIGGMLDAGVYHGFDGANHVGTIQRSHVAIAGAEDLGDGLSVTFRLSTRLEMGTGAGEGAGFKPFWHDESTVGFKGGWGALRVGRALTAMWAHDWKFDPWANYNRIASPAWYQWHALTPTEPFGNNGTAEYGRVNNAFFYDSPAIAGVTLHVSGSPERQRGPDPTETPSRAPGRPYSVALEYGKGALAGLLAFERNGIGDRDAFIAGKYTRGAVAIMAAHDDSRTGDGLGRSRATTLGATYRIEKTTFKAGFGHQRLNGGTNRFFSLGADYALSARTTLYTSLGHRNDADQASRTSAGVGISHLF
ncbi:MAG: porin [Burkholderiaceae bacterium]